MSNEKLRVLMVEPGKKACPAEIGRELEDLQKAVGGWIEAYYPFEDEACIICNDEGKYNGMKPNRTIRDSKGTVIDIIYGPFFICGIGEERFESLPDELMDKYQEMFRLPEAFIKTPKGILSTVYEPIEEGGEVK